MCLFNYSVISIIIALIQANVSFGFPNEKDNEKELLMESYQTLMLEEEKLISDSSRRAINIDATYYYLSEALQSLLSHMDDLKFNSSAMFKKIAFQIEKEAVSLNLSSVVSDRSEKLTKICYMKYLQKRIIDNGILVSESGQWIALLMDYIEKYTTKKINSIVFLEEMEQSQPNCEDPRVSEAVLQELSRSPGFPMIHTLVLEDLLATNPEFANLMTKAMEFAATENIDVYDVNITALLVFEPEEEPVKKAKYEANVGVKILFELSSLSFRNKMQNVEFQTAWSDMIRVLKLIELFADNEWSGWDLLACVVVHYSKFFRGNSSTSGMPLPIDCFKADPQDSFAKLRNELAPWYLNFFYEKLKQNDGFTNKIVALLRNKSHTMAHLSNLVGGERQLYQLWYHPEIRGKLLNPQFFLDKNRMLAHYRRGITDSSSWTRSAHRLAADITVWMMHLDTVEGDGATRETINLLWLQFRIVYDDILLRAPQKDFGKLSFLLRSYIMKMHSIINKSKGKKQAKLKQKTLTGWMKAAIQEGQSQWIESGNKVAQPLQMLQKLHFDVLQNFVKRETELDLVTEFLQLLADLRDNMSYRRNLVQFLEIEQIEAFFRGNTLTFNPEEFDESINKNLDPKVDGSNEINIKNLQIAESSGSKKEKNGKKKMTKKKGGRK